MKITKIIPKSLTYKVGRQMLTLKKNSPHIMFVGGVVGVIAGSVLASRATLKVGDTLDEMHEDIAAVKHDMKDTDGYGRDLFYAYSRGTLQITKLYAPAVIVTGVSIAALTGSHVTLVKRNNALIAAYTGLQQAYANYRERVREEVGVERELDIYHAAEVKKTKKNGEVLEERLVDLEKSGAEYTRIFDESSTEWNKDPDYNRAFLMARQGYFNQLLKVRGHVYLNEVLEALGFEHCDAGSVVGWVYDKHAENEARGDNYIDFGLYEARAKDFMIGRERNVILDFNVDGIIYGMLG